MVTAELAMELCWKTVQEWKRARRKETTSTPENVSPKVTSIRKWCPPPQGMLKLNVDASVFSQSDSFSVGMVMGDHRGSFVEAKIAALPCPATVLEAESIGVKEALSWIMQRGDANVIIETDSLLTVRALQGKKNYKLEVGHVIDHCKWQLQSAPGLVVSHIRKQANKAAHRLARLPCSINCFHVFTSPPTRLLETIMDDFSND